MIKNKFQKSNTNSKYKNVTTIVDGISFDSKAEAAYYAELKLRERSGLIKIKELQPAIKMTQAQIKYVADFSIIEDGCEIWFDVKGVSNAVFLLKKRLYKKYGKHILRIVKKNNDRFELLEEITPEGFEY